MADKDNIVEDSMDSIMEETASSDHLLGDMYKIMNCSQESQSEGDLQYDSDETMLTALSEELTVSFQRPTQVGSDDDTCLSSDSSSNALHSQISLFPTIGSQSIYPTTQETKSRSSEEIQLTICQNSAAPMETGATNLCLPLQQRQRARRKRKARHWTFSRRNQVTPTSVSQTDTKHTAERPYLKKHRSYMEELNVIEAKFSSIEKLMARKSRVLIERAKKMMDNDVKERMELLRKEFDEPVDSSSSTQESDSEQENEIAGLRLVRESRFNKMLKQCEVIEDELELKLEESIDLESDSRSPDCSQSILPRNSLHQSSNTLKASFFKKTSSRKLAQSVVDVIRPEKLLSDESVIYVPLINSQAPSGGKRRAVTNTRHVAITNQAFVTSQLHQHPSCYDYTSPNQSRSATSLFVRRQISDPAPQAFPISQARTFPPRPGTSRNILPTVAPSSLQPVVRNKPKPHLPQLCSRQSENQNDTVCSFNSFSQSQPSYSISRPPSISANQSTSATCLDISTLLRLGLVSHGPGVLSCIVPGESFVGKASIVGDGLILSPSYDLLESPMEWLKKLTSKTVSRTTAYKQVYYRGVSLLDISTRGAVLECSSRGKNLSGQEVSNKASKRVATETFTKNPIESQTTMTTTKDSVSERPPDPPNNLSEFMRSCTIRLVQDSELFVTSALFDANPWSEWELMEHLLSEARIITNLVLKKFNRLFEELEMSCRPEQW